MKKYTVTIEINVSENWIMDGFNPETKEWKESIEEAIEGLMPYAQLGEFKASVKNVIAPTYTIKECEELGLIPPAY